MAQSSATPHIKAPPAEAYTSGTNSVHTLPLSVALLVTLGYAFFFLLATFITYHQSDIFD
ncbi:hypothetical protein ccbrp13_08520 [Ktedonobacteria bacterium brp13]|nr:hypothetical protein ccbrp13_08520 [Ktedonobacteria bacterium brp13]